VILFLIQIGGLGIMTGAAFIFLFFKSGLGIKAGAGLKTILEEKYISEVRSTIKFIVVNTFLLEIIGAILLFFWWRGDFLGDSQLVFSSIFHSVSAFCNAGFSLFKNSLENFRGDIFINFLFSFLIILGGIGFIVLRDVHRKIISFLKKKKTKFTLHSKIVLISTVCLILLGTALFYVFERDNLNFLSEKELVLVSFFQSVTARTAGFNTIDIGELSNSTLLLLIFLMFIGGAPGSTAGGIKVISLVLIFLLIISLFKRKEEIVIFGRTIPKIHFRNVFVITSVYFLFCLVISFLMLYIENGEFEKILFETFSAVGTVGLSTGITPHLSNLGKILITISMFVGRILPLSLAIIGSRELLKAKILFPEEKVSLG